MFGCNLFSLAYNLSRERIDFNNPQVIHFDFVVLIFIEFDKFAWHVFIFGLFDGIVQYVIVSVYVRRYACI